MISPEEFTQKITDALGDRVKSVILYGSAARGDRQETYSDINMLIVVETLDRSVLEGLVPISKGWIKAGNPAPLLFTEKRIKQAEDVFPLEFLDISKNHKVLHGSDSFDGFKINNRHLRHQLEFELRGKLLHLRQGFIGVEGKPKEVRQLLATTISAFSILFKGVLSLLGEQPPVKKDEAILALKKHCPINDAALLAVLKIRDKDPEALKADPIELFEGVLSSLETVTDFVDAQTGSN